ncbi:MAG: 16S rRNA (cytidine(1402)-2'-O)-methyltransferase [Armatimonadetes bacterium]|nr:16S rRNA (cytidine(1402)-2'-O)-methyltransferase [Armatimonadota bacterium]
MAGRLVLVAGPIGNLGDISARALDELRACDAVIAEDSRVTGKLLAHFESKKPMLVLNEHASPHHIEKIVSALSEGQTLCLLTDAGAPGISDPGAQLVDLLRNEHPDIEIDCIPGATAVTTALGLSGFYAQRFAFLGFLPRKPGPIKEVLSDFTESSLTLVLFESPHRWSKVLATAAEVLGPRRVAICRELTKLHQQVWRGTLDDLPSEKEVPSKGEFTIVIEGHRKRKGNPDFDRE